MTQRVNKVKRNMSLQMLESQVERDGGDDAVYSMTDKYKTGRKTKGEGERVMEVENRCRLNSLHCLHGRHG